MTIPRFGRATPSQISMLRLAGYDLSRSDVTLDIPDDKKMRNMILGRDQLCELTGKNFGFSLAAWRSFLIANDTYGYTHPYAFEKVDEAILSSIEDKDRENLIAARERTGTNLLEQFLARPCFPFEELSSIIPNAGGVYRIFEIDSGQQISIYLGQSKNMRSHIMSKRIKSILQRRLKSSDQATEIKKPKIQLSDVYQVQFIILSDVERDWFMQFTIEHLKPLIY